jgi:hypothetical protein
MSSGMRDITSCIRLMRDLEDFLKTFTNTLIGLFR